jgi:hypothetical protein
MEFEIPSAHVSQSLSLFAPNRGYPDTYRCEVFQASRGVCDQIVDIFLLVNESIVPTKAVVGGNIPGDYISC